MQQAGRKMQPQAWCRGIRWRVAIAERDPSLLPVITKAVAQAISDRFGETDIRVPMRAIVVQASGVKNGIASKHLTWSPEKQK